MFAFALGSLLSIAQASSTAATARLPLAECLRADRVELWHVVRERTLLVRSGGRHFRIEMHNTCPTLGEGGELALRGAQATRDFICGNVGETAATRRGDCRVGSVTPLGREEFVRQVQHLRLRHTGSSRARTGSRREREALNLSD
ncbi:MAG: hypothetical protein ABIP49_02355 [Lysobacterales bacterium]